MQFQSLIHTSQRFFSIIIAAILVVFTARRWLFSWVARKEKSTAADEKRPLYLPDILLLLPFYNEDGLLPQLLVAVDQLNYPAQKIQLVLLDDGSDDRSVAIVKAWQAQRRPHQAATHLLKITSNSGKAVALNTALQHIDFGEIIVVFDADARPSAETLIHLMSPFQNTRVAAVTGRRHVANATASPFAAYSAIEALVHQTITLAAKDKLRLAPPVLGSNCAYRRAALAQVGGFQAGAILEDSDITLRLARAGWLLRYAPRAHSFHAAPVSWRGYFRQHRRWSQGFADLKQHRAAVQPPIRQLPWRLRAELHLFSAGYLDRAATLAALPLAFWQPALRRLLYLHLLTPWLQTAAALKKESASAELWSLLPVMPIFYLLDVAAALSGISASFFNRPVRHASRLESA